MTTAATILDEVAAEHDARRQRRVALRIEISVDGIGMSRELAEATDSNPYGITPRQVAAFTKRLQKAGVTVRVFRVTTTMEEQP